jgi:type VI secretion system protein VasI
VRADRLLAQVTPYGSNPLLATFDTTGLTEAIKPVQQACNWR